MPRFFSRGCLFAGLVLSACPDGASLATELAPDTDPACQHYARWLSEDVPREPLQQLLSFYADNRGRFENARYLSLADYSQRSTQERFYLLDLQTGVLERSHVSHGSGKQGGVKHGDPQHDAMLDACQHQGDRTNMTRVGFFETAGFYFSAGHDEKTRKKKGKTYWPDLQLEDEQARRNGLRLEGLSPSNSEARSRGVVMHEASYNSNATMGRSFGCPAFRPGKGGPIMEKIAYGSLLYGYAPVCDELMALVLAQVQGWEGMCEP